MTESGVPGRSQTWTWTVCGLLLLATMLNYMDRQALNQLSTTIIDDLDLDEHEYGRIESIFGIAFAIGALIFGWLADRINVRWLYVYAVLGWSAAGVATGFANTFEAFLVCRFFLGLAEAGNWPCALRTTQRILPPEKRTMGNSLLQSGAAFGAVLTPIVVLGIAVYHDDWRLAFWVIGSLGLFWMALWLLVVSNHDLALPESHEETPEEKERSGMSWFLLRRYLVLVVLVISINVTWHFFRVWLPLFLEKQAGYERHEMQLVSTAYYIATDVGTLSAGVATLYLVRRGMVLHRSRCFVFFCCALLVMLSLIAARLYAGPLLFCLLMIIGFGALGLFPVYYSLSQELTKKHQGKLTGSLGCINWLAMAVLHEVVGGYVKETKDYRQAIALVGLVPLAGFLFLVVFWGKDEDARHESEKPLS